MKLQSFSFIPFANGIITSYTADVKTAVDYFPFGSIMPGRSYNASEYKFGFNGQEKDDEISGATGSHYTATFWEYDSRIGRRWNLDPKPTIGISEYACFAGNPIWFGDTLGDKWDETTKKKDHTPALNKDDVDKVNNIPDIFKSSFSEQTRF